MLRRAASPLILAGALVGLLGGTAHAARKTVVLRSAPVAVGGFAVDHARPPGQARGA
jgi:hypothetical protein